MVQMKAKSQGRSVVEYLGRRPSLKKDNIIGDILPVSNFDKTHKSLVECISAHICGLAKNVNLENETKALQTSLKSTSFIFAFTQMGAFSGGLLCANIDQHLVLPEVAGIVTSIILSAGGILFTQNRYSKVKDDLLSKSLIQQEQFDYALKESLIKEIATLQRQIMDGVSPYSRYVKSERNRIEKWRTECEDIMSEVHSLRGRIKKSNEGTES